MDPKRWASLFTFYRKMLIGHSCGSGIQSIVAKECRGHVVPTWQEGPLKLCSVGGRRGRKKKLS